MPIFLSRPSYILPVKCHNNSVSMKTSLSVYLNKVAHQCDGNSTSLYLIVRKDAQLGEISVYSTQYISCVEPKPLASR